MVMSRRFVAVAGTGGVGAGLLHAIVPTSPNPAQSHRISSSIKNRMGIDVRS
jgi:hypothetical protein